MDNTFFLFSNMIVYNTHLTHKAVREAFRVNQNLSERKSFIIIMQDFSFDYILNKFYSRCALLQSHTRNVCEQILVFYVTRRYNRASLHVNNHDDGILMLHTYINEFSIRLAYVMYIVQNVVNTHTILDDYRISYIGIGSYNDIKSTAQT